jgi:LacI family transcriptional regulator
MACRTENRGKEVKATIYDVARRAQVSIATVSRVVSGRARVTEETRARVLEAVKELNYHPNPVAQGLALQSTRTLALIIDRFDSIYPAKIVAGAETEARAHDYHLLVQQVADLDGDRLRRISGRIDGIIISGGASADELLRAAVEQDIPTVRLGNLIPELRADAVVADNYGGAYSAMEHLIEHGYRRIAHIAGPESSPHGKVRARAYLAALQDHAIPQRDEYLAHGDYTHESGFQAMASLLELPEPPDAVFCADDELAMGAILAAHELGYDVPNDVAIVGFDGLETGAYVTPPLTSVYQPIEQLGRVAVATLLWRIAHPEEEPRETVLPTELVIRRSCGCPAVSHVLGSAAS